MSFIKKIKTIFHSNKKPNDQTQSDKSKFIFTNSNYYNNH